MGNTGYELSNTTQVFRYVVFVAENEGSMSGITIEQNERSQIIRQRLAVKFFVTPLVFYMCWRISTYAVALAPEEMTGLGWRCLGSLTAAGAVASIAVAFVRNKADLRSGIADCKSCVFDARNAF